MVKKTNGSRHPKLPLEQVRGRQIQNFTLAAKEALTNSGTPARKGTCHSQGSAAARASCQHLQSGIGRRQHDDNASA